MSGFTSESFAQCGGVKLIPSYSPIVCYIIVERKFVLITSPGVLNSDLRKLAVNMGTLACAQRKVADPQSLSPDYISSQPVTPH